ncbi:MAG: DUF4190 domain-containing protein [Myxococcota bacterium]
MQQTNSLAVASLILGILGLIGALPLIGSILAVVLGHMARGQIAADGRQTGEGLALGGLITGYLGILSACAAVLVFLFMFGGLAMLGIAGAAAGA